MHPRYGAPEIFSNDSATREASSAATLAYIDGDGPAWWYGVVFTYTAVSFQATMLAIFAMCFADEKVSRGACAVGVRPQRTRRVHSQQLRCDQMF